MPKSEADRITGERGRLYSVTQAIEATGLKRGNIVAKYQRGNIPHIAIGGHIFFTQETIDSLKQKH